MAGAAEKRILTGRVGDSLDSAGSDLGQPSAEAALWRALWVMGALWIAVQVHRQLLPALLGASPLLRDFGITADRAGLLAAVYFPIYGLMQIPSGLIADRGRLKRLLVGSCVCLGAAGLAFAWAPSLGWAIAARALVGMTSSLFWVPGLKLCLQLAPRVYGRSVGFMVASGSVGGVAALALLPLLLQSFPWRTVAMLASLPLFPLAAAMLLLPEPPADARAEGRRGFDFGALGAALRDVRFWRLAWPAMMWDGAWFGLLTWLPRYSRDALGVAPAASGLLSAGATLALIPGSYLVGLAASRHPNWSRRLFYLAQIGALAATLALLLLGQRLGPLPVYAVAFSLGTLFGAFFLYLSLLARDVPASRIGAATGLSNCLTFMPAFATPWLMGSALDWVDHPSTTDPIYSGAAYATAWSVAAAFQVAGLAGAAVLARWRARG